MDTTLSTKDKLQAQAPQQHDGNNKTQPPLRQLVPVDSKRHRKLQLESVCSHKARPGEELVHYEAVAGTGGEVSWTFKINFFN